MEPESFYVDGERAGRIFKTRTGVHPEDDWGELSFACVPIGSPPIPPELETLCRDNNMKVELKWCVPSGDRECTHFLAYFTYENRICTMAQIAFSRRGQVADVISIRKFGANQLRDLETLLLAEAARTLKIKFLFLKRYTTCEIAEPMEEQLKALGEDCAARFECSSHLDRVFSPKSPNHHSWLVFGAPSPTPFENRNVMMRTCLIQKNGVRFSLHKMIFDGDNPRRLTSARENDAYYDNRMQIWRRGSAQCHPPNYADQCPNMFLPRHVDSIAPILYIIDCVLLEERRPMPRPFRRFSRGLAIAMGAHHRLGASGMREMDPEILRLINEFT